MDSSLADSNHQSDSTLASGDGMRNRSLYPNESVLINTKSEEEEDELSFMKRFKSTDWRRYRYQKDMIRGRPPCSDPLMVYDALRSVFDAYENQGFPIIQGRDLDGGVKHYSYDELLQMTNCFESTRICDTLFGTLHRGTIQKESGDQDVLIKMWEYVFPSRIQVDHHTTRIHDELNLLRDPEIKSHPNVVNLIGFHCERRLATIYEGGSVKLLDEIIPTDTFSWNDRMKVASDMASMLETFHKKGLVHGGVNSKTILVDKDKCPVVYDFRLFSYLEDQKMHDQKMYEEHVAKFYLCHVKYLEGMMHALLLLITQPSFNSKRFGFLVGPPWSTKYDIFSYGILLLELINKRVYVKISLPLRTKDEILNYDHQKSVVDDSLYVDEYTALGITKLAVNCLKVNLDEQPTIGYIVRELKELMLHGQPNKLQKISY